MRSPFGPVITGSSSRRLATIVGLLLLCASSCSAGSSAAPEPTPEPLDLRQAPRVYAADWLVDAESIGVDGPGYQYLYREVADDRSGQYLTQSANHLAIQAPDSVLFCAAILRDDPYCAITERAEGTPNVLAYPLQLLQGWGPVQLYDLATWREVDLVERSQPDAWERRRDRIGDTPVECFKVVGKTPAASEGFEICFIDDDLRLVAAVDLQGDLRYEVDLLRYERAVDESTFEPDLDEWIEQKASLQEQLLTLFPEIPAARPTPTPDLEDS